MVVIAEVDNSPTLPHAKSPEHSLITPEHIENPISWCEMVIANHDIRYASYEMKISHRERRITMYIDEMAQDNKRYKKPMASSEDTTDKKRPSAVKKVRLTPVKKEIGSVEIVSV